MSIFKRITLSLLALLLLLCFTLEETTFAATSVSKPRISFFLKDKSGKTYKAIIYSKNEKSGIASYDGDDFKMVWAGANPGDKMYFGNYKIALQKKGIKAISNTGITFKNYTYNYTQKMIYKISSKYKGQPDLFVVSSRESSNDNSSKIFYVKNGKLVKVKSEMWYTLRPKVVGKNKYRIAQYDNSVGMWHFTDLQFNVNIGTFKKIKTKKLSYNKANSIINKW
jgi:hypothetical protein